LHWLSWEDCEYGALYWTSVIYPDFDKDFNAQWSHFPAEATIWRRYMEQQQQERTFRAQLHTTLREAEPAAQCLFSTENGGYH